MTDVAVVGFAQSPCVRHGEGTTSGVEMLVPVFRQVLADTGLAKDDIGFWCSGSSDYLAGRAFSFVQAVDAIGAFPPIMESHVEMDGAWALYEAWVKILTGEADVALAYGFGKSSAGELRRVPARRRWRTRRPRCPAGWPPRTCSPSRTSPTRSGCTTARRWAMAPPW